MLHRENDVPEGEDLHAVVIGIRAILRVPESGSILKRVTNVMRRYDDLRRTWRVSYPDEEDNFVKRG
jgi:hypothetical protein